MNLRHLVFFMAIFSAAFISGCGGGSSNNSTAVDVDGDGIEDLVDNCPNDANDDQLDSDIDGPGDACDALATTYTFENEDSVSTVFYDGQTARQILISDLVDQMNSLSRDVANVPGTVVSDLQFYYSFDADIRDFGVDEDPITTADNYIALFDLSGGESIIGNDTGLGATPALTMAPGSVSDGDTLVSKTGGNDSSCSNCVALDNDFFGWEGFEAADGANAQALVEEFFRLLGEEAADDTDAINISGGSANIGAATVTEEGLDLRQLVQKFLLGAVTFSQGTADYLSIDFGSASNLSQRSNGIDTEGAHDFDESFGYFGAARDYNDLTDAQIGSGYSFPESDSNQDTYIDVRSEFNFGNSVNCAKRDLGSEGNSNPTNFTEQVFSAYVLGREILQNAADRAAAGAVDPANLTDAEATAALSPAAEAALQTQITIVSQTWEKCIAATVIHYINDVTDNMGDFVNDDFADLANFLDLAKHWGEMKGFALGLQFSPRSPFRTAEVVVNGVSQPVMIDGEPADIDDLKRVLNLMGIAPVLADGTQNGVLTGVDAATAKSDYLADLQTARDILQVAYNFDAENVANW